MVPNGLLALCMRLCSSPNQILGDLKGPLFQDVFLPWLSALEFITPSERFPYTLVSTFKKLSLPLSDCCLSSPTA